MAEAVSERQGGPGTMPGPSVALVSNAPAPPPRRDRDSDTHPPAPAEFSHDTHDFALKARGRAADDGEAGTPARDP